MRRTLIRIFLTIFTLQAFAISARAYSIKIEINSGRKDEARKRKI